MIRIPKSIVDDIIVHAKEEHPKECCGILGGKDNEVSTSYRMTNTDNSSTTYFMEPREQFKVMKELRTKGLEITAIYHSHPHTTCYPSGTDVKLAYYPDSFYVIISLADMEKPEVRAFKIKDEKITEEKILIEKDKTS